MNPEIKAEWVAALRSGKYVQGYEKLHTNLGLCCLGVLCELGMPQLGPYEGGAGHPPQQFLEWSGLTNRHGDLPIETRSGDTTCLIDLNDSRLFSFDQIADVIDYFL
jgi:hypothetical protein